LAKLVECAICGFQFAITDEDEKKIRERMNLIETNSIKKVKKITVDYYCKTCKKMVKIQ